MAGYPAPSRCQTGAKHGAKVMEIQGNRQQASESANGSVARDRNKRTGNPKNQPNRLGRKCSIQLSYGDGEKQFKNQNAKFKILALLRGIK